MAHNRRKRLEGEVQHMVMMTLRATRPSWKMLTQWGLVYETLQDSCTVNVSLVVALLTVSWCSYSKAINEQ